MIDPTTNMFKCASGKHFWTSQGDAEKCCNGYRRILVTWGGDRQTIVAGVSVGFEWIPLIITPSEGMPST